mmetsp:Transcript_41240/g.100063  ORF Transcript_41240/g.100063 Transcript_41240/m.100063 type:complete len:101 (+) Transcript_41240:627-929(+)
MGEQWLRPGKTHRRLEFILIMFTPCACALKTTTSARYLIDSLAGPRSPELRANVLVVLYGRVHSSEGVITGLAGLLYQRESHDKQSIAIRKSSVVGGTYQ